MPKATPRLVLKGSPVAVDSPNGVYDFIGTAQIVDDDKEELSLDDIVSQFPVMKARMGGIGIPITWGHHDIIVGHSLEEEVLDITDAQTNSVVKGVRIRTKIHDYDETDRMAREAIEKGEVDGLSIAGFALEWELACDDDQCTRMHTKITKGNYRGFALCSKPRNRLARRLNGPNAPQVVQKALELGVDNCPLCQETIQYYVQEEGMSQEQARGQVEGLLRKGCGGKKYEEKSNTDPSEDSTSEPTEMEEAEMPLTEEELKSIVKAVADGVKEGFENIQKAQPEPEPKADPEPALNIAEEIKKAMEESMRPLEERLVKLEKAAEEPPKAEPAAEPQEPAPKPVQKDDGVTSETDPVAGGAKKIEKGGLPEDDKDPKGPKNEEEAVQAMLEKMPGEWSRI